MARQGVEALEPVYAKLGEGSFTAADICDPEIEVNWSAKAIDVAGGTTKGVEALTAVVRLWFKDLEDVRLEAERFDDRGDQVLVITVMRARGKASGIEVAERYGHLWTFRNGKAIRLDDVDPDDPGS